MLSDRGNELKVFVIINIHCVNIYNYNPRSEFLESWMRQDSWLICSN